MAREPRGAGRTHRRWVVPFGVLGSRHAAGGWAAIREVTAMGVSARVLTGVRRAFGPCLGLGLDAGRKAPGGPMGRCRGIEATEMGLE